MGHNIFEKIISLENLWAAWREFKRGKTSKREVREFYFALEDNLLNLHEELLLGTYAPGGYVFFYVRDPKLRPIHKASVRDRILFQAVFRVLYHIFDRRFIFDSYSCRLDKGTHAGVARLDRFARQLSGNYSRTIYALKCDVKKFFYSVDHKILLKLLASRISDIRLLNLLEIIINSFNTAEGRGLPLGNVTSQLFANIYLNEFDQYVKQVLKEKLYLRYCDDFIILGHCCMHLSDLIVPIDNFLGSHLKLQLHPAKVEIRKLSQGLDFLGYVVLPHHIVLRTKTKRRMWRKLKEKRRDLSRGLITPESYNQTLQSYLGVLKQGNNYRQAAVIRNKFGGELSYLF